MVLYGMTTNKIELVEVEGCVTIYANDEDENNLIMLTLQE